MNECDFCGDEFDYPPISELQEHDLCVCEACEDVATEQLILMGDMEEPDFEDEFGFDHFDV